MNSNNLFNKFCKERNIKKSTRKGYESAIIKYCEFHDESIENLISEALCDENKHVPLKSRKVKQRLLDFRSYLIASDLASNSSKTYFSKIKTLYQHFEVELPVLPPAKYEKNYITSYSDLPTKKHIREALEISSIDLKAIILFMASSGTAKAETLSLKVSDFFNATSEYHNGKMILETLSRRDDVIPTFYLKRLKTDKYYYTFCSPEASRAIVNYLKTRKNLKKSDKLFDFTASSLITKFQQINDKMNWGFKGSYRFFRTHSLRKFHASNIGLTSEYIDALQGRSKNEVHEAYIKTNPSKLKEIYANVVENVTINNLKDDDLVNQEFNIIINVFLSGNEYNII